MKTINEKRDKNEKQKIRHLKTINEKRIKMKNGTLMKTINQKKDENEKQKRGKLFKKPKNSFIV